MRKVALGALALLPLATFACTAILGDFEVGSSANNDGGGTDGATTDGGGTDGATDADPDAPDAANLVFTTCGISETSIRTIDENEVDGGGSGYFGPLTIYRISADIVRVVAQRNDFTGDGATVFTFNPLKNGNNGPIDVTRLNLQGEGRFLDSRRLAGQNNILALLFLERVVGAGPMAKLKVLELPDADPLAKTSVDVSSTFPDPTAGMGGGNFTGALSTYANGHEYLWAVGGWPSTASPGKYDLMIGHRVPVTKPTPAPVVIYTTADDRTVRLRDAMRSQTLHILLNDKGPDNPNDKGSAFFAVPEDTTGMVAPKDIQPAGSTKPWVVLGGNVASGDGIRVAAAEVDFNSTNFGQVHAGLIPAADLAGFDGSKIPLAFTLTSLSEVPSEGEARFFGEDMLWLGTPPDPLRGQGLNFIWYATEKKVMRAKSTGTQRLLLNPPHTTIDKSSIWLDVDTVTAVTADADVVFTEKIGTKWTLRYARLSCIR